MKKLVLFSILFLASLPTLAQEKYFHELKGMEDSTGTTHLFYKLFDSETDNGCCINWTNNIMHLNTFTMEDSILFESLSQTPIGSPSPNHDKFIDDYLFVEKNPLNPFWISNSSGNWSNRYSYTRGYNGSFFYSGHHWGNRIGYGKNDTLSFIAKNYPSNSAFVILKEDSLPSVLYHYPILVKAIHEEPLCFESGACFYGASDSVRFLDYNFLEIDPYQPMNLYLTRNDSLFNTQDLGDKIEFLNASFDWSNIGHFEFGKDSSTILAVTENRFLINGQNIDNESYSLLQSRNSGETWNQLKIDTTRIYISELSSFNSLDFYMASGTKLYFWNQLPGQFFEEYDFEKEITGIYSNHYSEHEIIYVLTIDELFELKNSVATSLKKLPVSNEEPKEIPNSITLHQNYPNPFNPRTTISFELDKSVEVTLTVFDALGRTVAVLVNEQKSIGLHQVGFDASNLSSGIYFYQLKAGEFVGSKRFTLIK